MKVKVFSSPDARLLEKQINDWLEKNNWVSIINVTQSSASVIVISIWYKEPEVPILG